MDTGTNEDIVRRSPFNIKVLLKGGMIGVIALLLLIPTYYVKELIIEREQRQKDVTAEITNKWAGHQTISTPVIVVPYTLAENQPTIGSARSREHLYYIIPDSVSIDADVYPTERHRGIYKVMLYKAQLNFSGSLGVPDLSGIAPGKIFNWNAAYLRIAIEDDHGVNEPLFITWNGRNIPFEPEPNSRVFKAPLGIQALAELQGNFKGAFNLNGSAGLQLLPAASRSTVHIRSPWNDPSFTGSILPQVSSIDDKGFNATWQTFAQKINIPAQWEGQQFQLDNATGFGVDLFIPVNGYQKTYRTIRYALLCIALTFAAFFLTELNSRQSAHPFQYALIGLAIVLFYSLLLSVSEYLGFNTAYFISTIATVLLIAWFTRSILSSSRAAVILSFILILVYTYIFGLLQLQDYSLLFGSIGLFISLAVVMHFSKKLSW